MTKAERTRAFIIEKTAPIFNKKGYAGTSLADLTAATGLTKGALYGNFENKGEMALAVYDYNIKKLKSYFPADIGSKTAIEKLLSVPRVYKKYYREIAAHGGCPILNTAVEADDNQPLLRKKVNKTVSDWKALLGGFIREGIQKGEIRRGVDPEKYACVFLALFEGGMMLSKVTNDIGYINESLDKMTEIIHTDLSK